MIVSKACCRKNGSSVRGKMWTGLCRSTFSQIGTHGSRNRDQLLDGVVGENRMVSRIIRSGVSQQEDTRVNYLTKSFSAACCAKGIRENACFCTLMLDIVCR